MAAIIMRISTFNFFVSIVSKIPSFAFAYPPITKASKAYPGYEVKPVFCTVYVPKKAKKQYIKWRLKGENDLDIDELWNKVVSY